MASCFASNTGQPRCRNGHYCTVLYRGEYIDRIECNHPACECKQALWREGERL